MPTHQRWLMGALVRVIVGTAHTNTLSCIYFIEYDEPARKREKPAKTFVSHAIYVQPYSSCGDTHDDALDGVCWL